MAARLGCSGYPGLRIEPSNRQSGGWPERVTTPTFGAETLGMVPLTDNTWTTPPPGQTT